MPQFAVLTDADFKNPMRIDYGFNFSLDKSGTSIKCTCGIVYLFSESNTPALKLDVSCIFFISKESWKNLISDSKIILPAGFLQHLATITTGTARGILFQRTEGTKYNTFHLPLLDITKAIKEDIVAPL